MFSLFDWAVLILLAVFMVKGIFRGLVLEVMTLAGLAAALILAVEYMGGVGQWLGGKIGIPGFALAFLSFSIVFFGILMGVHLIARLVRYGIHKTPIGWLDRTGGALFGLMKGALIASLLMLLVSWIPIPGNWQRERERSLLVDPFSLIAPAVYDSVRRLAPEAKTFCDEIGETLAGRSRTLQDQWMEKQLESLRSRLKGLPPSKDSEI